MLRLFVILVSVFAFSKVAFAADADMNKKPATEVTKDAADKDSMKDKMEDKMAEKMDDKAEGNKAK